MQVLTFYFYLSKDVALSSEKSVIINWFNMFHKNTIYRATIFFWVVDGNTDNVTETVFGVVYIGAAVDTIFLLDLTVFVVWIVGICKIGFVVGGRMTSKNQPY